MSEDTVDWNGRKILLVRHGEGFHNANRDWRLSDPRLTERGLAQARTLRDDPRLVDAELVVVSPLARALQTAMEIFGEGPSKGHFVVSPLHSERNAARCDRGRPKTEIVADFPGIQAWEGFAELPENWMHPRSDAKKWRKERLPAFRAWLEARPEQHVVVVGHGEFFRGLCGKHMDNCEVFDLSQKNSSAAMPEEDSSLKNSSEAMPMEDSSPKNSLEEDLSLKSSSTAPSN